MMYQEYQDFQFAWDILKTYNILLQQLDNKVICFFCFFLHEDKTIIQSQIQYFFFHIQIINE